MTIGKIFTLAEKKVLAASASEPIKPLMSVTLDGKPLTQKDGKNTNRIPYSELELIYMKDAIIFNGINKIVQNIMYAGYELECSNAKIKKFYEDFLESIGTVGNDMTWDELLTQIIKDQCIYGTAWVENIYNEKGTKLVDLDIIDAKTMDYLKQGNDILLDKNAKPVGYVQRVLNKWNVSVQGDPYPAGVSPESGAMFLRPERIAHFKLFTVGDGFYPVGLIEPAYNPSLWKLNIEKGLANSIYMSGFPIRVMKVGDPNHEPNLEMIEDMLKKMQNIAFNQNISIPYYDELKLLESKNLEGMQENLNHFLNQEVTSLGVPKPFATGSGEDTDRYTLINQDKQFRLSLQDVIKNTCSVIRKQIFRRIAELEGFNVYPTIIWGEIEDTDEIDKIKVMLEAVKTGVFMPEEIKSSLIRKLDIRVDKVSKTKTDTPKQEEKQNDKSNQKSDI